MLPTLSTERLTLVPLLDEHIPFEIELDSNPDVMRYIIGRPRIRDEIISAHGKRLSLPAENPGRGFWVGLLENTPIGIWMLLPVNGESSSIEAEIGYRLLPKYWKQGLASEGARALLQFCFTELLLTRVKALAMVVHSATRATMVNLGMRQGNFIPTDDPQEQFEGTKHGDVEYSITREEWERMIGA